MAWAVAEEPSCSKDTATRSASAATTPEAALLKTEELDQLVAPIAVTIGNIVGGSIMVGAVYWFVYLRNKKV